MPEQFNYSRGGHQISSFLEVGTCKSDVLGIARKISSGAIGVRLIDYGAAIAIRQVWPGGSPGRALLPPSMRFVREREIASAADFLNGLFLDNRPLKMAVLGRCRPSLMHLSLSIVKPDVVISEHGIKRGFVNVRSSAISSGICIEAACDNRARALDDLLIIAASRSRVEQLRDCSFDIFDMVLADGFHEVDRDRENYWVWTGAEPWSRFLIPAISLCARWTLSLYLYGSKSELDSESVSIRVDGRSCDAIFFPEELKIEIHGYWEIQSAWVQVELKSLLQHDSEANRMLGVAIYRVRLQAR